MRRRNPLLVPGTRNIHYWQYFVALEADLAATAHYVEPTWANMACYSVEFARILLTAGSEVDVLCKVLCQEHQLPVSPANINGYRAAITARFPGFTKLEILAPRYGLVRLPWQQWDQNSNPNWWRSYNNVKHERHGHFASANLGNALDAMAGLFVLVSYLCEKELRARTALPWPQLRNVLPYSPYRLEGEFCELRLHRILPSSQAQSSRKLREFARVFGGWYHASRWNR